MTTNSKECPKRDLKRSHRCTACTKTRATLSELSEHYQTHELKYSCDNCPERFRCLFHCSLHLSSKHDAKEFTCAQCYHHVKKRGYLLKHINTKHLNKFLHYCGVCGKGFDFIRYKREHEMLHKTSKPHVCVVCDQKFAYTRWLKNHQLIHHTVTIKGGYLKNQCTVCLKIFAKESTLEQHMAKHGPPTKKFMCDKCGRGFAWKHLFQEHYRTHTGDKPFSCDFCDRRFRTQLQKKAHTRTHTGEKPYKCKHCGKGFSQVGSMTIHSRIHTGEKPYNCSYCGKFFMTRATLTNHLKSCNGAKSDTEESE